MYRRKVETARFSTSEPKDLKEYDAVMNDPLCTVINVHKEKLKYTEYNEEGKPVCYKEWIEFIVTWEKRELA